MIFPINTKVMNTLYCSFITEEINRLNACVCLENLKNTKSLPASHGSQINNFNERIREFPDEGHSHFRTWDIVNKARSLVKEFSQEELIHIVLRSLTLE